MLQNFESIISKYQHSFSSVIEFNQQIEKIVELDFTKNNFELNHDIFNDIELFSTYISNKLQQSNAKFGMGGYLEYREFYGRSNLFDGEETSSPRRLHLGTDIWGEVNTKVFTPLPATIHSFAFNHHNGDYGATIILKHQLDDLTFFTLYGHLALKNIQHIQVGQSIQKGEHFAHFGAASENGNWPPHLHFQIILDLEGKFGDYPGVCSIEEKTKYSLNCPNPEFILQLEQFI
ncbi:MAG: peptidoglycan DD-metalloendopeptidase family protein [Chitinophagaceae bacterium]|nr:peptidoglycan DD-metalloendopeptidase family protein [Chitinophagaceae bacterium]